MSRNLFNRESGVDEESIEGERERAELTRHWLRGREGAELTRHWLRERESGVYEELVERESGVDEARGRRC